MADSTFASVSVALEQRVRSKLARQPNRSSVTANLLQKTRGNGKNVAFDVTVGTDVGQVFDDGQDLAAGNYQNDTELMALLQWANYGDAFAITGLAEDAAANEPTELQNLWMKKLMDAIHRTASKINIDILTGAGTAGPQLIHGLTDASGPVGDTGTYAGIDRVTYPQFAANVTDAAAAALSITMIEQMLEDIYVASGYAPSYIVTDPASWRKYAELVAPQKRYLQEVYLRGEVIRLDGGWQALEVNGIPMFKDKDMPANNMLFLNDQHVGLEYLPPAARLKRDVYLGEVPVAGTPQEQAGAIPESPGLMARLLKIANTGDKSKYQLLTRVQVWADRPNTHGRLHNFA